MTGQRIGYARVSTTDQNTEVQEQQLKAAGCAKVFTEQASGTSAANRGQLAAALEYAREGDTLVITRLDRLARSQADLHAILSDLGSRGIEFECTEQPEVNTSGPMGKLLLGVLGAVAEFETGLRRERQMAVHMPRKNEHVVVVKVQWNFNTVRRVHGAIVSG